jgi:hypothetical protein
MKKRTRRKVYALINPITYVIEGVRVATDDALDQLRIRELSAIDNLTHGCATEVDFYNIKAMIGICRTMALGGIGIEAAEACKLASEYQAQDKQRFDLTGRMATTGPGLQAYRDVFEYHDLQRQSISRAEYERFIQAEIKKVKFTKEPA